MTPHKTKPITESITVYKQNNRNYRVISLSDGTIIKTSIGNIIITPRRAIKERDTHNVGSTNKNEK